MLSHCAHMPNVFVLSRSDSHTLVTPLTVVRGGPEGSLGGQRRRSVSSNRLLLLLVLYAVRCPDARRHRRGLLLLVGVRLSGRKRRAVGRRASGQVSFGGLEGGGGALGLHGGLRARGEYPTQAANSVHPLLGTKPPPSSLFSVHAKN